MKMTRGLCVLLALSLYALSTAAQSRTAAGTWDGTIATPGVELRLSSAFSRQKIALGPERSISQCKVQKHCR